MIKKYLVTEYIFITEGNFYFKDFKNMLYERPPLFIEVLYQAM
jgi:hypothetical protein